MDSFAVRYHDALVAEWEGKYFPYEVLMKEIEVEFSPTTLRERAAAAGVSSGPPPPSVSNNNGGGESAPLLVAVTQEEAGAGRPGTVLEAAERMLRRVKGEERKVDAFYMEKEALFGERVREIVEYLGSTNMVGRVHGEGTQGEHHGGADKDEKRRVKEAIQELYRGLLLLRNYAVLNLSAVVEVRKAVDTRAKTSKSAWFVLRALVSPTSSYAEAETRLAPLLSELECRYALLFTDGSVANAKRQLFERKQPPQQTFLNTFNLGFFSGFSVPLIVLTLSLLFTSSAEGFDPEADLYPVIPVFRCTGVLILVFWLWGGVVVVFERTRINHIFILEMDPTSSLGHLRIFKSGALLSALWLACFLLFLASVRRGINVFPVNHRIYPAILVITLFALLLCPLKMLHRPTRTWLMARSFRTMLAPFFAVTFADNLIGDYMTSLVKVMYDAEYLACFYMSGDWRSNDYARCQETNRKYALPVLTALPLLWRFLQCLRRYYDSGDAWPHLGNAGKYAVATTAVTLGAFHSDWKSYGHEYTFARVAWLGLLVFSTLYAYTWDITMDWGLVWLNKSGKVQVRNQFQYGSPWVYVAAAVFNLFGRFVWMLTLITAPVQSAINHEMAVFAYAMVEVVRRSVWACLRIEHEHASNASKYRAVKHIPIAFHTNTTINNEAIDYVFSSVHEDLGLDTGAGTAPVVVSPSPAAASIELSERSLTTGAGFSPRSTHASSAQRQGRQGRQGRQDHQDQHDHQGQVGCLPGQSSRLRADGETTIQRALRQHSE